MPSGKCNYDASGTTSTTSSGTTSTTRMQWGPTSFSECSGARTTAQKGNNDAERHDKYDAQWGNGDGHECDAEREYMYTTQNSQPSNSNQPLINVTLSP